VRRHTRRCNVERLFAWLTQFRRIPVRYEYRIEIYHGFLRFAGIRILPRCFVNTRWLALRTRHHFGAGMSPGFRRILVASFSILEMCSVGDGPSSACSDTLPLVVQVTL